MEEDKAAAYYDELTRKGSGAARFKHGLGFSSTEPSSSSPPNTQLQSIRNKLKSKSSPSPDRDTRSRSRERDRGRYSKPSRSRDKHSRRRSRSRDRNSSKCRSRSRSRDKYSSRRRSRSRERRRSRSRENQKNGGLDYSNLIQGYHKMVIALLLLYTHSFMPHFIYVPPIMDLLNLTVILPGLK